MSRTENNEQKNSMERPPGQAAPGTTRQSDSNAAPLASQQGKDSQSEPGVWKARERGLSRESKQGTLSLTHEKETQTEQDRTQRGHSFRSNWDGFLKAAGIQ